MARDKKKEQQTDTYLLEKIQPQGGITFMDAKYISTGGGYEACLHIFDKLIVTMNLKIFRKVMTQRNAFRN